MRRALPANLVVPISDVGTGRNRISVYMPALDRLEEKRGYYQWTQEKRAYLMRLVEEYPKWKPEQYANALNKRFRKGARATVGGVNWKLSKDIYVQRPDLRKNYKWTDEKRSYLIELKETHPKWSNRQYAAALNEKFSEGVHADALTIRGELNRRVYQKRPDLQRVHHILTEEKRAYLVYMVEKYRDWTIEQYADALNRVFTGVLAGKWTVVHALTEIYRERPELRRRSRKGVSAGTATLAVGQDSVYP